jgi:hypothetical protein
MPTGPFLSAKEEYLQGRVLTLFPSGSDCGTAVTVKITEQLAVGEDQDFRLLKGRVGGIKRAIELDSEEAWQIEGENVEPYIFDPLHITLESFPDDTLPGTGQANFNRPSTCCGNYQRLSATTEYFSHITLQSAAEPLCHKPLLASVFFPNRKLIDDRGVACIVTESWRHQSLINLIILDREKTDRLVWRALLTIREFMEAGWELHRLEENLYINLNNLDIFIDLGALSDATPIGAGKVEPEHLRREIEFAVKRMRPRGTSPNVDRMIAHLLEAEVTAPQIPSPGRTELMLSRLV